MEKENIKKCNQYSEGADLCEEVEKYIKKAKKSCSCSYFIMIVLMIVLGIIIIATIVYIKK
jgi:hypothetical protein